MPGARHCVTASVQQSADDIDPGCGRSGEQTAAGSRYTAAAVLSLDNDTGSSLVPGTDESDPATAAAMIRTAQAAVTNTR